MIARFLMGTLIVSSLISMPCVAEEMRTLGSNIQGIATLSRGAQSKPCEDVFLVPATNEARPDDANETLQMDWAHFFRLHELRAAAMETTHCLADGSFEFRNIAGNKVTVVAHFSWLRGKWSTGGFLVRQINIPLPSPLEIRAH